MIYRVVFLVDVEYYWTNGQHILIDKIAEGMLIKLEKNYKIKKYTQTSLKAEILLRCFYILSMNMSFCKCHNVCCFIESKILLRISWFISSVAVKKHSRTGGWSSPYTEAIGNLYL